MISLFSQAAQSCHQAMGLRVEVAEARGEVEGLKLELADLQVKVKGGNLPLDRLFLFLFSLCKGGVEEFGKMPAGNDCKVV